MGTNEINCCKRPVTNEENKSNSNNPVYQEAFNDDNFVEEEQENTNKKFFEPDNAAKFQTSPKNKMYSQFDNTQTQKQNLNSGSTQYISNIMKMNKSTPDAGNNVSANYYSMNFLNQAIPKSNVANINYSQTNLKNNVYYYPNTYTKSPQKSINQIQYLSTNHQSNQYPNQSIQNQNTLQSENPSIPQYHTNEIMNSNISNIQYINSQNESSTLFIPTTTSVHYTDQNEQLFNNYEIPNTSNIQYSNQQFQSTQKIIPQKSGKMQQNIEPSIKNININRPIGYDSINQFMKPEKESIQIPTSSYINYENKQQEIQLPIQTISNYNLQFTESEPIQFQQETNQYIKQIPGEKEYNNSFIPNHQIDQTFNYENSNLRFELQKFKNQNQNTKFSEIKQNNFENFRKDSNNFEEQSYEFKRENMFEMQNDFTESPEKLPISNNFNNSLESDYPRQENIIRRRPKVYKVTDDDTLTSKIMDAFAMCRCAPKEKALDL